MTSSVLYYTRSGRVGWQVLPYLLFAGVPAAVLLAAIYAVVTRYNPFIYVSFIATGLLAAAVGVVAGACAQAGHSRSRPFDVAAGLALGLVAWWTQWLVWTVLMYEDGVATARHLAVATPSQWLDFLQYTSEHLHMSVGRFVALKRDAPHFEPGSLQWIWGIEALLIVGGAGLCAYGHGDGHAYSERARAWAKSDWEGELALDESMPHDVAAWKSRLEQEGVAILAALPPAAPRQPALTDPEWHTLKLRCRSVPDDPAFCLVSVDVLTHKPKEKKGAVKVSSLGREAVDVLMAEPQAYRRLVADLQARAPAAEAAQPAATAA